MSETLNFDLYSGDDMVLECTLVDQDGAVINLDLVSEIKWQFSRKRGTRFSATPLVSKALGSGIEKITPGTGRFDITIDAADTEAIDGVFYHEAEITSVTGKTSTVLIGDMTINKDLVQ